MGSGVGEEVPARVEGQLVLFLCISDSLDLFQQARTLDRSK